MRLIKGSILFLIVVSFLSSCLVSYKPQAKLVKSYLTNNGKHILKEYYSVKNFVKAQDNLKKFDSVAIWNGVPKAPKYDLYTKTYFLSEGKSSNDSLLFVNSDSTTALSKRKIVLKYVFIDGIFRYRKNFISGDTLYNRIQKVEIIDSTFIIKKN